MKILTNSFYGALLATLVLLGSCGPKYEINYETGFFSDTVKNLSAINSVYDDFNCAGPPTISYSLPLVFSSNRYTQGLKYDLVDYELFVAFNQYDGSLTMGGIESYYPFFYLTQLANTEYNEFGPFTTYLGGQEYFFFFSSDRTGNMEIFTSFFNNYSFSGITPIDPAPFRVKGLGSPQYDAYAAMSSELRQVIFCSERTGNLDLYMYTIPDSSDFLVWAQADTVYDVQPMTLLNSPAKDVYPYMNGKLLLFASDREGGYGGFDLYYSLLTDTIWGAPVNFGPTINTAHNEYRPVCFLASYFENDLMIFSSDRPGGKGGIDLYYVGIPRMME